MENPIKMDDLGVPLFLETPIWWLVLIFIWADGKIQENNLQRSNKGMGFGKFVVS